MGPQEWSDGGKCFRTLGTTSVPGAKVSDNQRPVFCTLTIFIRNAGFRHWYFSAINKDAEGYVS